MGLITNINKNVISANPSSLFLNKERTKQEIEVLGEKLGIRKKSTQLNAVYFTEPEVEQYNSMRGIFIPKGFKNVQKEGLIFQFNPTDVSDKKDTTWEHSPINGFSNVEYVWSQGGARTMEFSLQFECTPGVNYDMFGYNTTQGSTMIDTIDDIFPNGTMDFLNRLRSFLYPIQEEDKLVTFLGGNPSPQNRFSHPPVLIFCYGSYYLEGLLTSADAQHTLFDKNLKPRRTTVQISFSVIEGYVYDIDNRLVHSGNGGNIYGNKLVNND